MANGVNIHKLRRDCAELEVHFSSDIDDGVKGYNDAQSKLALAKQLEAELHNPDGEWETLASDIRQSLQQTSWVADLVKEANSVGQREAEAASLNKMIQLEEELGEWETNHTHCLSEDEAIRLELEEHKECPTTIKSLQTQVEEHKECPTTIKSLQTQVAEHKETIKSLRQQLSRWDSLKETGKKPSTLAGELEAHSKCAYDLSTLRRQLEAHDQCFSQNESLKSKLRQHDKTISSLEQQLSQLSAATPSAAACKPMLRDASTQVEVDPSEVSEKSFADLDNDMKSLCAFLSDIFDNHVKREDPAVMARYQALSARMKTWGASDLYTASRDPTRAAGFLDFVREVTVSYDKLTKYVRGLSEPLSKAAQLLEKSLAEVESIGKDRDSWQQDCMDVLDRAQSLKKAKAAREAELLGEIRKRDECIAEFQSLLDELGIKLG